MIMSHLSILFLTASSTALLLYRVLLLLGAGNRMIFDLALLAAGAVFALWLISTLRTQDGEAG
jgi:hypothetical protein